MKYTGDNDVNARREATRRFVLEGQDGLGIRELELDVYTAAQERIFDGDKTGGGSERQSTVQGDGFANPRGFRDRADRVADRSRSFI